MGAGNQGAGAGPLLLYGIFFVFVALMALYGIGFVATKIIQMFI